MEREQARAPWRLDVRSVRANVSLATMQAASERFMRAILDADRASAYGVARAALVEGGLTYVYEELVQPALVEIGSLWERNLLSVADEHVASAVAQATIAALYPSIEWPPRGPKAVVAAVVGEAHTLGARMFADLIALDGWDDVFLGGDVPPAVLAQKAHDTAAVVVALSAATRARVAAVRETVWTIRERAPEAKILVGGRIARELVDAKLEVDAIAVSASGGAREARRWKC